MALQRPFHLAQDACKTQFAWAHWKLEGFCPQLEQLLHISLGYAELDFWSAVFSIFAICGSLVVISEHTEWFMWWSLEALKCSSAEVALALRCLGVGCCDGGCCNVVLGVVAVGSMLGDAHFQ